jgi:hypothetical protein
MAGAYSEEKTKEFTLKRWYSALRPRRLDIFGSLGAEDTFIIEVRCPSDCRAALACAAVL